MREARNFFQTFDPQSIQEFTAIFFGPHSGHVRMVVSYWDMAASFVVNGAIDAKMFNDANAEHWGVFAKVEPFLPQLRDLFRNPAFMKNLEAVCLTAPDGRARIEAVRERMRRMAGIGAAAATKL